MSLHRIYLPSISPELVAGGDSIAVDGDEAAHALRVKRVAAGDHVELLNGRGLRAVATVERVERNHLTVRVGAIDPALSNVTPRVTIAAPAPKGWRADQLIEQLSQLGAARWTPLVTERSIANPRPGKTAKWRRGAIEAAKQCGRPWLLEIDEPVGLAQLLATLPSHAAPLLLADAGADGFHDPRVDEFTILIGPEGGFTDDEEESIFRAGATPVGLSPFTLRIETACAAAMAAVNAARSGSAG